MWVQKCSFSWVCPDTVCRKAGLYTIYTRCSGGNFHRCCSICRRELNNRGSNWDFIQRFSRRIRKWKGVKDSFHFFSKQVSGRFTLWVGMPKTPPLGGTSLDPSWKDKEEIVVKTFQQRTQKCFCAPSATVPEKEGNASVQGVTMLFQKRVSDESNGSGEFSGSNPIHPEIVNLQFRTRQSRSHLSKKSQNPVSGLDCQWMCLWPTFCVGLPGNSAANSRDCRVAIIHSHSQCVFQAQGKILSEALCSSTWAAPIFELSKNLRSIKEIKTLSRHNKSR